MYEEFFLLKYHGNWSFAEAYNLPITIRRWFLQRLADQIKKENEKTEEAMQLYKAKINLTSEDRVSILKGIMQASRRQESGTPAERMMQAMKLMISNKVMEKKLDFEQQLTQNLEIKAKKESKSLTSIKQLPSSEEGSGDESFFLEEEK